MGWNRDIPNASATCLFVCSQDTGIPCPFDADAVAATVPEAAAVEEYLAKQGWASKLGVPAEAVAGVEAEARKMLEADPVLRVSVIEQGRIRAVLDALYAEYGAEVRVPRLQLEKLGNLDAVCRQARELAKSVLHRKYRESGDETILGLSTDSDVFRFKVHNLTPAERSEAKGMLRERDPGVPELKHIYNVNAWILRRTLVGVVGWGDFQADPKDKHVSEACLATLDDEWVIELGTFVLELAELRRLEKKA